jgi:hypothetical protein
MVCIAFLGPSPAEGQLRPDPGSLDGVSPELMDRLRADLFTYFRFLNRPWTARACEAIADVREQPIVRLHGDAHIEQFALTKDAWGLDDFDDSARGPSFIDVIRFLASIDLATRQRSWTRDRDALWDRFLEGYRRGLSNSDYRPPEPAIVRRLRGQAPITRVAYLAWGESQMQPMNETASKSLVEGMEAFERFVRRERPDLAPGYFAVIRAGWLRIGVGSATARKVLVRVQGATANPEDDQLIEAKEVVNLSGLRCLEESTARQAVRVIDGSRQLGRLKHDILAIGPTQLISAAGDRAETWLDWCVFSWDPSYRELHLGDLQSVRDLSDIAFDSGVQLGAGKVASDRKQALSAVVKFEGRLRKETRTMVEELVAGWREFAGR